jgi:molybdenum cofactor cytidylyltransferase
VTAGLILAAGESRRMGSPKPLLRYQGQTFLDRLMSLFARSCSPVIVVLGAGADRIRSSAHGAATFVVNHDWPHGQTSSLQCGLASVPAEADGVLYTLVDHPAVEQATIEALLAPERPLPDGRSSDLPNAAPLLRIPRYQSRRGHPIWFSSALIPEFLTLHDPLTAKEVVHAHLAETHFIDLDDPGIVADIDDPSAYRTLTGAAL